MNKLLLFITILLLSSCTTIRVNLTVGVEVSSDVKKEMVKANKRIHKQARIKDNYLRKHKRKYDRLQRKSH